jgi:hypothetical protein
MNDIVDDGKKSQAGPNTEELLPAHDASVTEADDGSTHEPINDELYAELFWANAITTTLHQTHPRVSTLKTELVCQYKFENNRIYVKTLRYKMTTRSGNWDRANIDIGLQADEWKRKDSPDSMIQDTRWHDHVDYVEALASNPAMGVSLAIRVNYDGSNNDVEPHEGWGYDVFPARTPIIESPASGAMVTMPFTVSGKNGLKGGRIKLTSSANTQIGYPDVQADGRWSASVTLPAGALSFYAEQTIGNQTSGKSNTVTIRLAPPYVAPCIDFPANAAVIKTGSELRLKGRGTVDKVVDVMTPHGAVLHATTTVLANGTWEADFNLCNYPNGGHVLLTVGHRNMDDWSADQSFTLVSIPTIILPANSTVTDPQGPISGVGAVPRAVVEILKDLQHTFKVGQGTAQDNGQWSVTAFNQEMPPGAFSIVARQSFSGTISDVSAARSFKVRPPTLTAVNLAYPTLTSAAFSGAGYTGATIEITIINGPAGATAPPAVTVSAGIWNTTSQNWPIGEYDLKAIQKVSDNAGGWILSQEYLFKASTTLAPPVDVTYTVASFTPTFSGKGTFGASVEVTDKADGSLVAPAAKVNEPGNWSTRASQVWPPGSVRTIRVVQKVGAAVSQAVELTINIDRVPSPTNVRYTVNGYTPTFSGNGINGATVQLLDDEGASSAVPDAHVVNQQWSSRAPDPWGPTYQRNVNIRQGLNNDWSEGWVVLVVTIPLLAPIVRVVDDGLSPVVSGTCWPGATLSLKYSDSAVEHKPVNTNGTWTYKRSAGFAPEKEHTVTVTQTFAGRPSPSASQTFSVSPQQLMITEPSEDADSHYDMFVRGTNGHKGATLQLRDAQHKTDLGEPKPLTADGDWFIELKKLEFRKYQIDAIQTIAGRESRRSAVRNYFVTLMPPIIKVPEQDKSLARTSTYSGTGEPLGQVTIWRENPSEILCRDILIGIDGRWSAEITLPVGNYSVKAIQTFQAHISKYSASCTYQVVPAAPVIESPGRGVHIGRSVVVSGFGYPQDVVEVTLTGSKGTQRKSSPVLEDRTWSLRLEPNQPAGNCDLVAVSLSDGFESATSVAHPVVLGTFLPGIDKPASGSWVEHPLRFVGKGRTGVGRVVTWYDPEKILLANITVTDQGWRGEVTQALHPGGHWCRFQQTITDAADGSTLSDWVESERFDMTSIPPETQP